MTNYMKSSFLAHGKVILIGEHSVVYGYDAIALPIKALNIRTTVEASTIMWMDTKQYHGPLADAPSSYDGLKYVVATLCQKAEANEQLKITYTGEIPIERGLGSSATVALGTAEALNEYFQLKLTHAEIMAITNHAEMINHGKASGLDAATVNSDNLVYFNTKDGAQKLDNKLGATLLIMDTGQLGNTKEAVTMVRNKYDQSVKVKNDIARLGELTKLVKTAWLKKDAPATGSYFDEAQVILASLGLSTDHINQLQKIAQINGALGFKLSGGGLGGVVIALCTNQQVAEKIAHESQALIDNYWIEQI